MKSLYEQIRDTGSDVGVSAQQILAGADAILMTRRLVFPLEELEKIDRALQGHQVVKLELRGKVLQALGLEAQPHITPAHVLAELNVAQFGENGHTYPKDVADRLLEVITRRLCK